MRRGAAYAIANALEAGAQVDEDTPKVGVLLTNQVKVNLSRPGSGRFYRRGGATHRASAPGEPPAVDTGAYRASWRWELIAQGVRVFPEPDPEQLGGWLEFGTSRMAARPHLRPAVNTVRNIISGVFATGIEGRERGQARADGGTG